MKYRLCLLLAAALASAACAASGGCAKAPAPAQSKTHLTNVNLASAFGGGTERSMTAAAPAVQAVDVYQLSVPVGAVSRSNEFWKRVNETSVDVATYDLLQKNGFRVGVAPAHEWDYFRGILEQHPTVTRRTTVSGAAAGGSLELSMKKNIDFQNLIYLTDDNTLIGRTYEKCENLLTIAFQAAPRRPGQVRMTLCPLVRATRRKFQVSVRNEETEYDFVKPERLYDLNLCADIPVEGFLVVAPSTQAKWTDNLGSLFLVAGGAAEQFEHVLLIVPRHTRVQSVRAAK